MPVKRRPYGGKPVKLVDLCRINTDAFRHMTDEQLKRAYQAVGTISDFTEKERDKGITLRINPRAVKRLPERRSGVVNYLLSSFISNLRGAREVRTPLRPDQEAKMNAEWVARYGKPMPTDDQIRAGNRREADRDEKTIWDLQTRLGCSIKPDELVARDAERAENKPAVAKIRKKALIR